MTTDHPILLCYDGSEDAEHAIREAAALLAPRRALVLSVWQDAAALPSLSWAGGALPNLEELFAAARDGARRTAEEGAGIARAAGFDATAVVAEAKGPVWAAVEEAAEQHDAGAIVVGSRGLSGISRCCSAASPAGSCITPGDRPSWSGASTPEPQQSLAVGVLRRLLVGAHSTAGS